MNNKPTPLSPVAMCIFGRLRHPPDEAFIGREDRFDDRNWVAKADVEAMILSRKPVA